MLPYLESRGETRWGEGWERLHLAFWKSNPFYLICLNHFPKSSKILIASESHCVLHKNMDEWQCWSYYFNVSRSYFKIFPLILVIWESSFRDSLDSFPTNLYIVLTHLQWWLHQKSFSIITRCANSGGRKGKVRLGCSFQVSKKYSDFFAQLFPSVD